jgi:hypothetical protein
MISAKLFVQTVSIEENLALEDATLNYMKLFCFRCDSIITVE